MTIVANPARVCAAHAAEFWTGLLSFTHDRSGPCVKEHEECSCVLCGEMAASLVRAAALAGTRPSPADHADFRIALAS